VKTAARDADGNQFVRQSLGENSRTFICVFDPPGNQLQVHAGNAGKVEALVRLEVLELVVRRRAFDKSDPPLARQQLAVGVVDLCEDEFAVRGLCPTSVGKLVTLIARQESE
jgi:hypothetical protein